MKSFTYSEARQRLAVVLDLSRREGAVRIQRRDGESFILKPESSDRSPLDVEGVDIGVTRDEIISAIHAGRRPV